MKISGIIILIILITSGLFAQDNTVLEIKSINIGDIEIAGFTLHTSKEVHIEAEGAGEEKEFEKVPSMMADPNGMFVYAWILNAKSRKLVWRMTVENTTRNRRTQFNRKFDNQVELSAGEYEVYFSALKPEFRFMHDGFFSLGKLFDKLFRDENWFEEDKEKWFIRISGVDEKVGERSVEKYHNALYEQAHISIVNLRDSDFRQEGFKLTKEGVFQVYAVGEAFEGETYDYGWIVNAENSQKLWETIAERGEYAGGAIKNRMWRDTIELEPGDYWVYFVMDDSHSPSNWNANPPYDPGFYGITITGVKGEYDPSSVKELIKLKVEPIVELTRVSDDQFLREGFKISEPMQVRVYALGEGRNGEMFDYGWIINMETGRKVWEMNFNRTRHGGGADKNRLIDEVISLPEGAYMVYYKSDDSHSFYDWNSPRPYNPTSWGITVYPADPKYKGEQIQKLTASITPKNVISQIVRVRDGRHIQERFQLEEDTRIRIYAIGEGDWDEMYDYGWIEKVSTGEVVWKMFYEETRWAGGARKNRKVDQEIVLSPGDYLLHYKTDGSHSYNDWNDDPPEDPINYGITLYNTGE